jgi:hypothetical protein
MFPKKFLPFLLMGAIGVPYAATQFGGGKSLASLFGSSSSSSSGTASGEIREDAVRQRIEDETKDLKIEKKPSQQFEQFFNFGITKGWVRSRWERVSTQLGLLDLQGYRVPLVTGTELDDLAGSLTYYFDAEQQLQRITFQGTTGDIGRITQMLATHYGMAHKPTNDAAVVLVEAERRWGSKQVSQLRIRDAAVATSADAHRRFQLALVLERPAGA